MDDFKQECKLCDKIITDKNFKVIEDVAKNIFDILLLKLTLIESRNVMCTKCSSNLIAAFSFKSTCLNTNNTIIPYVDFKNPKPVYLKQFYAKEKGNKQGGRTLDNRDVCRLCLKPMFGYHKSIQKVPVSSIEIYIPEINFELTRNPVICAKCHDALHVHSTFIKNCLDVDKKRKGNAMNGQEIFLNNQSIKTEEIEIKSEETDEETLCDIKKEVHDEGDTSLQSQTASAVQMYECDKCPYRSIRKDHLKQHQLTHKDPSEVKMYKCKKCKFITKRKGSLKQHYLTHRDPTKVQVFKCDECGYKTIHKYYLKQHQLRHKDPSEVRMFKCDECEYKSIHKS